MLRCTMKSKVFASAIALTIIGMQSLSADVVLLSDDFNRTTGKGDGNTPIPTASYADGTSSWGGDYTINRTNRTGGNQIVTGTPNIGAPGLSVPQTALGSVGTLMQGNARTVGSFMPALLAITNPAATAGFKVGFQFDRATDSTATGNPAGSIGIGLGLDPGGAQVGATANTWAQDNSTFAVSFQQATTGATANPNGNMQTFHNATNTTAAALTNVNYGTSPTSPLSLHNVEIHFTTASGLNSAFDTPGNVIDFAIFVDDLTTAKQTGTFTTRAGDDLGRLTFSTNIAVQAYIDNLTVTAFTATAVPEPASMGLLGLAGLGMAWRRRRVNIRKSA
jgi:hypothetical protein